MVVAIVCLIGIKRWLQFESLIYKPKGKKESHFIKFQTNCLVWNTKGLEKEKAIWCLPLLQQVFCWVRMPEACREQTWDSLLHETWQVAVAHQFELMCFHVEFVLEIGWDFRDVERLSPGPLLFPVFLKAVTWLLATLWLAKKMKTFVLSYMLVSHSRTDTLSKTLTEPLYMWYFLCAILKIKSEQPIFIIMKKSISPWQIFWNV